MPRKIKVSLIIPTRNEEGCIGKVLGEVPRDMVNEVIVVDGLSTDATREEAKRYLRKADQLILQKTQGYGGAFLEAFPLARGDLIIMMDADGSHNPTDIYAIVDQAKKGYDYIMASRYMPGGRSEDDTIIRFLGNKVFTWLTNIVHGTHVSDSLYLYTAITRKSLKKLHLTSTGFEFCTEIIVKAHKVGLKFAEVPVIERPRFAGKSKVNALWHGLKILSMLLRRY